MILILSITDESDVISTREEFEREVLRQDEKVLEQDEEVLR